MESFKIDAFKQSTKGTTFPEFRELPELECSELLDCLRQRLSLTDACSDIEVVSKLEKIQQPFGCKIDDDTSFDLQQQLNLVNALPEASVYVNWYRFDKIDCLSLVDLANHFSDIWYPSSDDIDIFDSTLMWVLSISHEGYLKYVHF